ncbi:hypothetical protein DH2020_035260 [Rehmannia glutinosa]|uniref:CCHC-type domain-containing protein n=1 Tax=Rehmannia glutinosa TaxID=99300 RepID=A0ABR0V702_REHGL
MHRIQSERTSYGAPHQREGRRGFSISSIPDLESRHIASECTSKALCWNCREPGHTASNCPNEGLCHSCGKSGHRARDCPNAELSPGDLRLCNNCLKPGHLAAECTNGMACKNCRKTGHIARDCQNDPVCNSCNISGHVARQCPKGDFLGERGQGGGTRYGGGYRDMVCRNCNQFGHMSRDCIEMVICRNCGGRGHMAFECPSGRFIDRWPRSKDGIVEGQNNVTPLTKVDLPQANGENVEKGIYSFIPIDMDEAT